MLMRKIFLSILAILTLTACAGARGVPYHGLSEGLDDFIEWDSEENEENPFVDASEHKTSNIALTNTTFAYPVVRSLIEKNNINGAKNSVRTEEFLNYFKYGYVNDTENGLNSYIELSTCPWNADHHLASVFIKAKPAKTENIKNNIVILVDRSGSMTDVFGLVKTSLNTLVDNLGNDDKVSIVSYASASGINAEGLTGKDKNKLRSIINDLKPGGSTNGSGGIETAYNLAEKYFIEGGNNRVVILTDGDFNVGKVSGEELTELIQEKAGTGVYLTCVGYRSYNNGTLYTLANNGNGNAYYIDGEFEARKVFEEELGKSLYTVAKDAKCQIEFSNAISQYRLLGYENRQLTDEEFNDQNKDSGEIMSDHTTVAMYELVLNESFTDDYYLKTVLRYKDPVSEENQEVVTMKNDISVTRAVDYDFTTYVAEYVLSLIESQYKQDASLDHLLDRMNNDYINDKYRDDFASLVSKTKALLK